MSDHLIGCCYLHEAIEYEGISVVQTAVVRSNVPLICENVRNFIEINLLVEESVTQFSGILRAYETHEDISSVNSNSLPADLNSAPSKKMNFLRRAGTMEGL